MTDTPSAADALTDEAIIQAAVIKGFMLSTAHGQGFEKLMPVSDSATLISFARDIERMARAAAPQEVDIEVLIEDVHKHVYPGLEYRGRKDRAMAAICDVIDYLHQRNLIGKQG